MIINVLAEFERVGLQFEWSAQDEIKCKCPFHADDSPSCCVNVAKQTFNCFVPGCLEHGNIIKLLARYLQTSQYVYRQKLQEIYGAQDDKVIPAETVERYHSQIWQAGPLLEALRVRGIDAIDIRQYRLGENEGRITIPVPNANGEYVGIRRYLPGAPGKDKMKNYKGYGKARLFPISQLSYPAIMLCGGECKAIVAAKQLNKHNIGAICVAAGEGNWSPEFSKQLRGKRVFVCMDIDAHGQRAANALCLQIRILAEWVGNLILPLDPDKHPKGDINDFVATESGDLFPLLEGVAEYVPTTARIDYNAGDTPEDASLAVAIHADKTGKRVRVGAIVSVMDTSPYIIPKELDVLCDRSQRDCATCPVFIQDQTRFTINPESPAIIELICATKESQIPALKSAIGIPRGCKVCEFQPITHYNIEDARISPQLEITANQTNGTDRFMQPAFCIGKSAQQLDLNESYNFTGRMFPHPKTQQATLLISDYDTTSDALSNYKCDNLEELALFWPNEDWSAENIGRRLQDIYGDFSANVTRIYQREDLHLGVDLTYHSPLLFDFDGKRTKGWMETLIVGDSSQGKSEITCGQDGNGGLKQHFGLGARVVCKNASVAGLLGGCADNNGRYFVQWGIIPNHDRRLVILEELSGASPEVISKLTDMRSSGIAEIPKIEKRKTHARTRLIAVSNPRSQHKVHQSSFGVQIIKELIGAPEDIRRFDWCFIASECEINEAELNRLQESRPFVPHYYTGELCRKLILWAWTRKPNQVIFDDAATELILSEATRFCSKFTSEIPIVDKGSMRNKLARLAAALAARTFSCSDDYESIYIHAGHVDYICKTLDRMYSSPVFGYLDYSQAIMVSQALIDPEIVKLKINETSYPRDICQSLLSANKIDLHDLQDWCALERQQGLELLSLFVRKHCLVRDGRNHYRKTGEFIALLRAMIDANQFPERPPHIPRF